MASTLTTKQIQGLRELGIDSSLGKPIINQKLLEKIKLIEQNYSITTNAIN